MAKDDLMETVIKYGLLALVAYLIYQKVTGAVGNAASSVAGAAKNATQGAGLSVSDLLYNLGLGPSAGNAPQAQPTGGPISYPAGSVTTPGQVYYTVAMPPNGQNASIDAATVGSDGSFSYQGQSYTLVQGAGGNAAILSSSIIDPSTYNYGAGS